MIARSRDCDSQRLVALIHQQLRGDEERMVTEHLDHCEDCRAEMEQLTASQMWWQETQTVLRDSAELSQSASETTRVAPPELQGVTTWIKSLLTKDDQGQSLGLLDRRPVREVIGQGGMGVVVKVWDEELHRPLAVKLLSPMLAGTGAARQRFFREAQSAAAVVHPNIVPIYSINAEGTLPYLVMPYVAGGNLQQRIDREGALPLVEILAIGLQIAEGLAAAHRQGLVHRDIKPANILLDEGGHRVMLSDFGLARTLDDATITQSGMIAGTPHYMSPEQARGEFVDGRSDLYSLGAVLYAMSTGRPPVRGETALAVIRRVGEEAPVPVYEINETLPVWLDHLLHQFLTKDPAKRLGTAEEAAELLRHCLAHVRAPGRNALPNAVLPPRVAIVDRTVQVWQSWSRETRLAILAAPVVMALWFVGSRWSPSRDASQQAEVAAASGHENAKESIGQSIVKPSGDEVATQPIVIPQFGPGTRVTQIETRGSSPRYSSSSLSASGLAELPMSDYRGPYGDEIDARIGQIESSHSFLKRQLDPSYDWINSNQLPPNK